MSHETHQHHQLHYNSITTVPASPTTDQDVSDEALYSQAGFIDKATRDIDQLGYLGHTSPTTDQPVQQQTKIYSPAVSNNRGTGDTEQLEYCYRGKQLEYQYRPIMPGKEEIMRIYEDRIYRPPDMTEKPGGLQIKGSGIRLGRSCTLQTALHQQVVEAADSDSKLEELLRDTPEPGTPPVTSLDFRSS